MKQTNIKIRCTNTFKKIVINMARKEDISVAEYIRNLIQRELIREELKEDV